MRNKLGLRKDNNVLIMLDNDNLSLLHFPLIFKQEATFAFSNQRDAVAEHVWQLDYLKPKVVFLETRMIAAYALCLSAADARSLSWIMRQICPKTSIASGTW
jgi:fatty-acyl-CoA synthase